MRIHIPYFLHIDMLCMYYVTQFMKCIILNRSIIRFAAQRNCRILHPSANYDIYKLKIKYIKFCDIPIKFQGLSDSNYHLEAFSLVTI